jgi:hypothetical protein
MPVVKTIVPSGSAATAMAGMYNHHRALGLAYISVNIPMNSLQGLPLLALDRIASFSDHDTLSALVVACTQLHEPAERRLWRHLNLADHGSRSSRFEDLEDTTPVWQAAGMIDKSGWQNSPISTRVLDQLIELLEARPEIAGHVHKVSIDIGTHCPDNLDKVLALVAPRLRALHMYFDPRTRDHIERVDGSVVIDRLAVMPQVKDLNLIIGHQWVERWSSTLALTPNVTHLRVEAERHSAGGWGDCTILAPYSPKTQGPLPTLSSLAILEVYGMQSNLEPAIRSLVEASSDPCPKVIFSDPSLCWNPSWKFREWMDSGRCRVSRVPEIFIDEAE